MHRSSDTVYGPIAAGLDGSGVASQRVDAPATATGRGRSFPPSQVGPAEMPEMSRNSHTLTAVLATIGANCCYTSC